MDYQIVKATIPEAVVERWQHFVDTISSLLGAPSAMINRLDPPELEVFRSSIGPCNPFPAGTRMPLLGIYCEAAVKRRQRVQVTDARNDPEWADSPTAKAGIYAYLGFPLFWPDGNVFGTLCVVDTKENLWGEYAETLLATFKDAIETHLLLVYANQTKSDFLTIMSHEIHSPMTAILGYSEFLMGSNLDPEQRKAVTAIRRNSDYLTQLVNEILHFSQAASNRLTVQQTACSPCQILKDVVALMRPRAEAKGLQMEIEYGTRLPSAIYSDPVRLRQILVNVATNAVKFTERGQIRFVARLVTSDCGKPMMQFNVFDTGVGMTEEEMAGLFQPRDQVASAASQDNVGAALGLLISRKLAQQLGGDITVTSVPGKGSVVSFTVGASAPDDVTWIESPHDVLLPTDSPEQHSESPIRLDARILLAEDAPDTQRLIAFYLWKAGAEFVVTDNGRKACELALAARDAGNPFDVILMDGQMPIVDGYEAAARLRQAGYRGTIIAMTTERNRCLAAGCDDYVSKPIDRDQLLSILAQHVPQRAAAAPVSPVVD